MNEIKSTMDIIMEKTKDLTLSKGEREEIQKEEIQGKVNGLLQKLDDAILDPSGFRKEFQALEEENRPLAREVLHNQMILRLDPFQDNSRRLKVLAESAGIDPHPIEKTLSDFREKLTRAADRRKERLGEDLHKRGISGSAVVPNLEADTEWKQIVEESRKELRSRLSDLGG